MNISSKSFFLFLFLVPLFLCFNTESCNQKTDKDVESLSTHKGEKIAVERELVWHWEDKFTNEEKQKITRWLEKTTNAKDSVLGIYPFKMHFYIKRVGHSYSPVPWAHTQRGNTQSVHFYVNLKYSLDEFLQDWTAPHEISHLSIPFVGAENSWFAEGYASFMQYQIMQKLAIYTPKEVKERYHQKLQKARLKYQDKTENLIQRVLELKKAYHYPEMYWGSAGFFILIDAKLREQNTLSLTQLVTQYQKYCREKDKSLQMLLNSWNRLSGKNEIINKEYTKLLNEPGIKILNEADSLLINDQ